MTSGRPLPRAAIRIVAVLVLGVITVVSVEAAWRVTERIADGIPLTTFFPRHGDTQFLLSPFLVFGPRIEHQIVGRELPEQAYFDAAGFRTNEAVEAKPPGEFRILAVGGSTTENYRNSAGLHWPLVLECRLREAGRPNVRVLNASMSAYSTAHTLIRLQFDLLDYEPDMVIVMHAINDLNVTYRALAAGLPVDGHYRSKYVNRHFTNMLGDDDVVLFRSWRGLTELLRPAPSDSEPVKGYDLEPGRSYFERNLSMIAALLRHRGAFGVFLTMPIREDRVDEHRTNPENAGLVYLPTSDALRSDMDVYNRTIQAVADSSQGILSVDMAAQFPDDRSLFLDIVHYTTEGVVTFGDLLAREIVDRVPTHEGAFELTREALRRCDW